MNRDKKFEVYKNLQNTMVKAKISKQTKPHSYCDCEMSNRKKRKPETLIRIKYIAHLIKKTKLKCPRLPLCGIRKKKQAKERKEK